MHLVVGCGVHMAERRRPEVRRQRLGEGRVRECAEAGRGFERTRRSLSRERRNASLDSCGPGGRDARKVLATLQLAAHRAGVAERRERASPFRTIETQALIDGLRLWDPGITLPRAMDDLQRGQLDRACGALKQGHGWHAWDTHREVQTRVALLIAQKCM